MNLKTYLVHRDQYNYKLLNGLEDPLLDNGKKRKHDEMSKEEEDMIDGENGSKKRKLNK